MIVEPESLEDKESDDPEDTEGQTSRLWVDRFSPRHYTELLSDDVSFVFFSFMHQDDTSEISITEFAGCFVVVYQPMFAQVVKTLGRRCVWKREEVPPR